MASVSRHLLARMIVISLVSGALGAAAVSNSTGLVGDSTEWLAAAVRTIDLNEQTSQYRSTTTMSFAMSPMDGLVLRNSTSASGDSPCFDDFDAAAFDDNASSESLSFLDLPAATFHSNNKNKSPRSLYMMRPRKTASSLVIARPKPVKSVTKISTATATPPSKLWMLFKLVLISYSIFFGFVYGTEAAVYHLWQAYQKKRRQRRALQQQQDYQLLRELWSREYYAKTSWRYINVREPSPCQREVVSITSDSLSAEHDVRMCQGLQPSRLDQQLIHETTNTNTQEMMEEMDEAETPMTMATVDEEAEGLDMSETETTESEDIIIQANESSIDDDKAAPSLFLKSSCCALNHTRAGMSLVQWADLMSSLNSILAKKQMDMLFASMRPCEPEPAQETEAPATEDAPVIEASTASTITQSPTELSHTPMAETEVTVMTTLECPRRARDQKPACLSPLMWMGLQISLRDIHKIQLEQFQKGEAYVPSFPQPVPAETEVDDDLESLTGLFEDMAAPSRRRRRRRKSTITAQPVFRIVIGSETPDSAMPVEEAADSSEQQTITTVAETVRSKQEQTTILEPIEEPVHSEQPTIVLVSIEKSDKQVIDVSPMEEPVTSEHSDAGASVTDESATPEPVIDEATTTEELEASSEPKSAAVTLSEESLSPEQSAIATVNIDGSKSLEPTIAKAFGPEQQTIGDAICPEAKAATTLSMTEPVNPLPVNKPKRKLDVKPASFASLQWASFQYELTRVLASRQQLDNYKLASLPKPAVVEQSPSSLASSLGSAVMNTQRQAVSPSDSQREPDMADTSCSSLASSLESDELDLDALLGPPKTSGRRRRGRGRGRSGAEPHPTQITIGSSLPSPTAISAQNVSKETEGQDLEMPVAQVAKKRNRHRRGNKKNA